MVKVFARIFIFDKKAIEENKRDMKRWFKVIEEDVKFEIKENILEEVYSELPKEVRKIIEQEKIKIYICPPIREICRNWVCGRCKGKKVFLEIGVWTKERILWKLLHEVCHVLQGKADKDRLSREIVAGHFADLFSLRVVRKVEEEYKVKIGRNEKEKILHCLLNLSLNNVREITEKISKILGKKDIIMMSPAASEK